VIDRIAPEVREDPSTLHEVRLELDSGYAGNLPLVHEGFAYRLKPRCLRTGSENLTSNSNLIFSANDVCITLNNTVSCPHHERKLSAQRFARFACVFARLPAVGMLGRR